MLMLYRTDDGREFTDRAEAEAHEALLAAIDRFCDSEGLETGVSRKRARRLITGYLEFAAAEAAAKFDETEPAPGTGGFAA